MEGLKAPAVPQKPQLQMLNTAGEIKTGLQFPKWERSLCWCSDVSGHLTSPIPPPTGAIFLFEVSNAATAVEKANLGCKQEAE